MESRDIFLSEKSHQNGKQAKKKQEWYSHNSKQGESWDIIENIKSAVPYDGIFPLYKN